LIVEHVARGAQVLRLKSGDPTVFGRLDEELEAIAAQDISYSIVPGITAASAAAAALGRSLTRRGRNSQLRVITGHDMAGYAEHDWRDLAKPDAVAAIYMGKTAARFIQGRLLMHGADPLTPVSIIENCSRPDQVIRSAPLNALTEALTTWPDRWCCCTGFRPGRLRPMSFNHRRLIYACNTHLKSRHRQ